MADGDAHAALHELGDGLHRAGLLRCHRDLHEGAARGVDQRVDVGEFRIREQLGRVGALVRVIEIRTLQVCSENQRVLGGEVGDEAELFPEVALSCRHEREHSAGRAVCVVRIERVRDVVGGAVVCRGAAAVCVDVDESGRKDPTRRVDRVRIRGPGSGADLGDRIAIEPDPGVLCESSRCNEARGVDNGHFVNSATSFSERN